MPEEYLSTVRWRPAEVASVRNPENCWESFSMTTKHLIESVVSLFFTVGGFSKDDEVNFRIQGWPALLAEAEHFINGTIMSMWGNPLPYEFFKYVEANPRPIMIASRELAPIAYLDLTEGLEVDIRTMYGTGEFLYPIVKEVMSRKLKELGPAPYRTQ